jgi:hypothetical protein
MWICDGRKHHPKPNPNPILFSPLPALCGLHERDVWWRS